MQLGTEVLVFWRESPSVVTVELYFNSEIQIGPMHFNQELTRF